MGARLRPGRLAEGAARAGQDRSTSRRRSRRTKAAAAQYYPAIYWYAMLGIPDKSEFPGSARQRHPNEARRVAGRRQDRRLHRLPRARHGGDAHDPAGARPLQELGGSLGAAHHVGPGDDADGQRRSRASTRERALKLFADWTDRIAAGELPPAQPPRPQGVERNVVVTLWDWGNPKAYLHDEISTDKRNPTRQRQRQDLRRDRGEHRPHAGARPGDARADRDAASRCAIRRRRRRRTHPMAPSPYWGDEPIWDSQTSDAQSDARRARPRLVHRAHAAAATIRTSAGKGSTTRRRRCSRSKARTASCRCTIRRRGKFTLIDTCFTTHHLAFAEDANHTLWTSARRSGEPACSAGSTARCSRRPATSRESQGWTPFVLDTNGNGKRDDYVEPDQPVDPAKDKRVVAGLYGVAVNPGGRHGLGHRRSAIPGYVVRVNPGRRSDATPRSPKSTSPPTPGLRRRAAATSTATASSGRRSRAAIWRASTAASARAAQRPDRDRQAMPGRLDAVSVPGPAVQATSQNRQRGGELLHLGRPVRHVRPRQERADRHRQPQRRAARAGRRQVRRCCACPIRSASTPSGMDGRIDDAQSRLEGPRACGRPSSTRAPFHIEGGKGTRPKVVRFQLRPDPLAD